MGFKGPAAPLLPAWLASMLPAAFPWDRKEARLPGSPSLINKVPTPLLDEGTVYFFLHFTTIKSEQVKFMHFKHTATGNCTLAFLLSGEKHFLHPYDSENLKYLLLTCKYYIFKCVFTGKVSVKNSTETLTHVFNIILLVIGCSIIGLHQLHIPVLPKSSLMASLPHALLE